MEITFILHQLLFYRDFESSLGVYIFQLSTHQWSHRHIIVVGAKLWLNRQKSSGKMIILFEDAINPSYN